MCRTVMRKIGRRLCADAIRTRKFRHDCSYMTSKLQLTEGLHPAQTSAYLQMQQPSDVAGYHACQALHFPAWADHNGHAVMRSGDVWKLQCRDANIVAVSRCKYILPAMQALCHLAWPCILRPDAFLECVRPKLAAKLQAMHSGESDSQASHFCQEAYNVSCT